MKKYDVIVIGAGSGGLSAAIGAKGIGAKVLLVEKNKIGGDCTHYGCVPSKTLINMSQEAKIIRKYYKNLPKELLVEKVLEKTRGIVNQIYKTECPEEIIKLGIDVVIGSPKFIDKNIIQINNKRFISKRIIIATGSRAKIPQIKGIETIKYLTNKEIFNVKKIDEITIMGGGPIGCELACAFNNLGIKTTILHSSDLILNREDNEASKIIQQQLIKENVRIITNAQTYLLKKSSSENKISVFLRDIKTKKHYSFKTQNLLIATGRTPNIETLNLEKAGIKFNSRGIIIDKYGRTSNKFVYAIGDVVGGMQFTHLANSHAKSVLSTSIFRIKSKFETDVIPRVTFTNPQVASVGITPEQIRNKKEFVIIKKDYSQIDRAITDQNTIGFIKLILDKKGFIRGATILGSQSGELIGEVALAMKNHIKITKLADTIHPYPTYSYGLRNCADLYRAQSYSKNKKKWVQRIFGIG